MKRTIAAMAFAVALPLAAQAQEHVNVEAGDVSVHVGEDGVKVKTSGTKVDVGQTGVQVDVTSGAEASQTNDSILTIQGVERVETHTCDANHVRTVRIDGADNRITLKGDCARVEVAGTDNVVRVEGAAVIHVTGVDNKISYVRGKDGKAPVIQKAGVDNTVVKRTR